ncbi:hypothetical protein LCGC14_0525260 [marine sediment metagenome]|uniref:Uncharacterized protein n=1 Tax=marine sediment metagenome TaxID=412755 RepID=A0A0F9SFM2_9ZZZZ|nr:hypothetical protein [Phycisphaerae bacterium]HDZ44760.1 hypothetical protein [Phycisphaerae bacterium]
MTDSLPFGYQARNPLWPEAHWNLTGLFVHDQLILQVYSVLEDRYGCHLNLDSIHGAPEVPWNCGRISTVRVPTPEALEAMVRSFNDVGIGVYFTFSNHLLDKSDLANANCNMLLEGIDNGLGLNGVILASDLLLDYVRQRHPELRLTASIVKVTEEEGRGDLGYYRSVLKRYDGVMVHPDDGFEYDLLEQLDREKTEIMVNEDCAYLCTHRINDYQVMAELIKSGLPDASDLEYEYTRKKYCRAPGGRLTPVVRSCNFSMAHLLRVYEMGFRRFKLQGRQNMPGTFLFDLLRFSVEPELLTPVIFKAFVSGQVTRQALESVRNVRRAHLQEAKTGVPASTAVEACPAEPAPALPTVVGPAIMAGTGLPTGMEGRHPLWPDGRWSIEGLTAHGQVIRNVLGVLTEELKCQTSVDGVYGELQVRWNGLPRSARSRLNLAGWAEVVGRFNKMDIGVFCIFNSHQLQSADLGDESGNGILEILDHESRLNGVEVASDVLADHIRSRHPELRLSASLAKTIAEGGCGQAEHYNALAERFDVVAVSPSDGFDLDLLARLDRDRIEIVVNDDAPWGSTPEGGQDESSTPRARLAPGPRSRNFTVMELKRVYDLGYRRFRLRNASASPNVFLYDILRYMVEPTLLLPVILKSFTNDWAELHKRRGP